MAAVPASRIRLCNDRPVRADRDFVLYWMIAARRLGWNFGLQRAVQQARALGLPLVVLEALRCDYRWASERLHRFILDGMRDNAADSAESGVHYYAYIEPKPKAGRGLIERLARDAALIVTDDFPTFFLPRMVDAAARRVDVAVEKVDGNGLLPMRIGEEAFKTAHAFRRFVHRNLLDHLELPEADPLGGSQLAAPADLAAEVTERWPNAATDLRQGSAPDVTRLPVDHTVAAVDLRGGSAAAERALDAFLERRLPAYGESRNHPDEETGSGLSPFLHFGHISSQRIFAALTRREEWDADRVDPSVAGKRSGWWGMGRDAEAFLDQLVTWRELGFNMCVHRDDYDRYESLPDWARTTLEEHQDDAREHVYELDTFEIAATHDEVWNAAQNQLRREGRIHNYLRMLWGKKILEWTASPRDALAVMIELNNKYALDGRDPNSYSGIFWCLGRHDRPFGPERPIYGKVRYMSSRNTVRKLRIAEYLERYTTKSSRPDRG